MAANYNQPPQNLQQIRQAHPQQPSTQSNADDDPTRELDYTPNFGSIFTANSFTNNETITNAPSPQLNLRYHRIDIDYSTQNQGFLSHEPLPQQSHLNRPQVDQTTNTSQPQSFQENNNTLLNHLIGTNSAHQPLQQQQNHATPLQQQQQQPSGSHTYNNLYDTSSNNIMTSTYPGVNVAPIIPTSNYPTYNIQPHLQPALAPNIRQQLQMRCQSYIPPPTYVSINQRPRGFARSYRPNILRQSQYVLLNNPARITVNNESSSNTFDYSRDLSNRVTNTATSHNSTNLQQRPPTHSPIATSSETGCRMQTPANFNQTAASTNYDPVSVNHLFQQQPIQPQRAHFREARPQMLTLTPRVLSNVQRNQAPRPRLVSAGGSTLTAPPRLEQINTQSVAELSQQTDLPQQTIITQHPVEAQQTVALSTPVSVSSTTRLNVVSAINIDSIQKTTENKACQVKISSPKPEMISKKLTVAPIMVDESCQTDFEEKLPELKKYTDRASSPIAFSSQVRFKVTPKRRKIIQTSPKRVSEDESDDEINVIE